MRLEQRAGAGNGAGNPFPGASGNPASLARLSPPAPDMDACGLAGRICAPALCPPPSPQECLPRECLVTGGEGWLSYSFHLLRAAHLWGLRKPHPTLHPIRSSWVRVPPTFSPAPATGLPCLGLYTPRLISAPKPCKDFRGMGMPEVILQDL